MSSPPENSFQVWWRNSTTWSQETWLKEAGGILQQRNDSLEAWSLIMEDLLNGSQKRLTLGFFPGYKPISTACRQTSGQCKVNLSKHQGFSEVGLGDISPLALDTFLLELSLRYTTNTASLTTKTLDSRHDLFIFLFVYEFFHSCLKQHRLT